MRARSRMVLRFLTCKTQTLWAKTQRWEPEPPSQWHQLRGADRSGRAGPDLQPKWCWNKGLAGRHVFLVLAGREPSAAGGAEVDCWEQRHLAEAGASAHEPHEVTARRHAGSGRYGGGPPKGGRKHVDPAEHGASLVSVQLWTQRATECGAS